MGNIMIENNAKKTAALKRYNVSKTKNDSKEYIKRRKSENRSLVVAWIVLPDNLIREIKIIYMHIEDNGIDLSHDTSVAANAKRHML